MSFIYCLNTSTIGPQPLMEKIRLAGKHGFAGIELWHDDVFAYVEQGGTVADVNKAVADEGLIVPCTIAMKGWCEASDDEYSTVLEDVKRRMNLAAELGSPYIVATPAHVPVDYAIIKRRYKELLELGREIGVKPTFEYLGFCVSVYRIDQALEIVTAVDDPDATILLDAFHNYRGGSTFDDLTKVPLNLIGHYHLDDAPADPPREQQRAKRAHRPVADHGRAWDGSLHAGIQPLPHQSPSRTLRRANPLLGDWRGASAGRA